MAKSMAETGHKVHIITVEHHASKKSFWWEDVQHENITIHYLPLHYPKAVLLPVNSFSDKVKYRLSIKKLQRSTQGTIYDKAVFWKEPLRKKIKSLQQQTTFKTIIATGAPFSILYHMAALKEEGLFDNLLCDLRDPWLENKHYGMQQLTTSQKAFEEKQEASVLANATFFAVPVEPMAKHYKQKYPEHAAKVSVLPHAYDSADFQELTPKTSPNNKLTLVYGGTLGLQNMEKVFGPLLTGLKALPKEIRADFNVICYTHTPIMQQEIEALGLQNQISYRPQLPYKEYLQCMSDADGLCLFLADYTKDWMITKFCEFLPLKKPVIVFSEEGEVGRFVQENNLGYGFNTSVDLTERLLQLHLDWKNDWPDFNRNFAAEEWSVDNVVSNLLGLVGQKS